MAEETRTRGKLGTALGAAGRFIKKHRKLFVFLAVLAVAAVVVAVLLGGGTSAAGGIQAPQTTALERMDLEQIVAGTGTLQSASTREVTSTLSYDITEVYVKEGDYVEAGQLLAMLDTTDIDKDIAEANKSIADAAASDALSLSQAERKLKEANESRDLNLKKNEQTVTDAEKAKKDATAARKAASADREPYKAAYETALAAWEAAGRPATADPDPEQALIAATYEAALAAYTPFQQAYEAAKAAEDSAKSTCDRAVETRDTAYRNDTLSIENAQDSVNTQKLRDSAATARTQLEGYLETKEKCQIVAPVAGTITAMTAEAGASAGGSGSAMAASASAALFTIEDTSRLEITSSIPEYDATLVKPGMGVTITSDALDGTEWTGTVKSISPKATDSSGNFTVVIEVTSPVGELAIGMSAKVNIITESKQGVFAVPYDAVTTNAAGENVVYVLDGKTASSGEPAASGEGGGNAVPAAMGQAIVVRTGMETDYYIEISGEGLTEGLLVLTDPEGKNVAPEDTGTVGMMMAGRMEDG